LDVGISKNGKGLVLAVGAIFTPGDVIIAVGEVGHYREVVKIGVPNGRESHERSAGSSGGRRGRVVTTPGRLKGAVLVRIVCGGRGLDLAVVQHGRVDGAGLLGDIRCSATGERIKSLLRVGRRTG
jgi:hypothetical protein